MDFNMPMYKAYKRLCVLFKGSIYKTIHRIDHKGSTYRIKSSMIVVFVCLKGGVAQPWATFFKGEEAQKLFRQADKDHNHRLVSWIS